MTAAKKKQDVENHELRQEIILKQEIIAKYDKGVVWNVEINFSFIYCV